MWRSRGWTGWVSGEVVLGSEVEGDDEAVVFAWFGAAMGSEMRVKNDEWS